MALVELNGPLAMPYPVWPPTLHSAGSGAAYTSILLDAATEICALSGRVFFPGRSGTKNITSVIIGFGATTPSTGSSTVRVSLQDVATGAGQPMQPDGVVDESWTTTITNIVANAVATVTVTSRTVAYGALLSVVVDYSTFSGTPALNVRFATSATPMGHDGHIATKLAGTWAQQAGDNSVILGFDDGTYGCLYAMGWPIVSWANIAYNTGSAADEYGNMMTVPSPCYADGIWALVAVPAGVTADYNVVLYEGTAAASTAIATYTSDAAWNSAATTFRMSVFPFSTIVTLTTTSTYWVSIKPTTATSITIARSTVVNATQMAVFPGGTSVTGCSRADAGTWTNTTTERTLCGLMISGIDNGAGGAASMAAGILTGGVFG